MTVFSLRNVCDEKEVFITKIHKDIEDSSFSTEVKNFLYKVAVRICQVVFRVSDDTLFSKYNDELLSFNQRLGSEFQLKKPRFSQDICLKIAQKKFKKIAREVVRDFFTAQLEQGHLQANDVKNIFGFSSANFEKEFTKVPLETLKKCLESDSLIAASGSLEGSNAEERLMILIQGSSDHRTALEQIQRTMYQVARKDALSGAEVIVREFDASIDMPEKDKWKLFACSRIHDVSMDKLPKFIHENFLELTSNLPENFAEKISIREYSEGVFSEIMTAKVDTLRNKVFSHFDLNIGSQSSQTSAVVDDLTSFSLVIQSGKYIERYLPMSDYYEIHKWQNVYDDFDVRVNESPIQVSEMTPLLGEAQVEQEQQSPICHLEEVDIGAVMSLLTTEVTQVQIVSEIFQKYSSQITEEKFFDCFQKWDRIALDPADLEKLVCRQLANQ